MGAGTERLEEELKTLFPHLEIERFDSDVTQSVVRERAILKRFAQGQVQILVGTQMLTKGFDFEKLTLVAVIHADSLFAVQDFRADERALQLLQQFRGRAGRRGSRGRMMLQTSHPDHPVLRMVAAGERISAELLLPERRTYSFPPFVRLILMTVKDASEGRLWRICRDLEALLRSIGIRDCNGPVQPLTDRIGERHIRQFWIKLPRNARIVPVKEALRKAVDSLVAGYPFKADIAIDVDPA